MSNSLSNTQNGLPTHSNNFAVEEQPPPSYNQVMGLDHITIAPSAPSAPRAPSAPSAPSDVLSEETFPSTLFNSSKRVRFEYNSSDDAGYSFFIRDENGSLQAKGYVFNCETSVQNMNGTQLMKINKIGTEELNGHKFHKFDIFYKSVAIGIVKVGTTAPAETCLQIINSNLNHHIIVRPFPVGQFAIFRDNTSGNPLCHIQIDVGEYINENDFAGTVIFHPETGITTEEQLLCTAAAISFKVIVKQGKEEGGAGAITTYMGAFFIGFIVIVIICILFVKKGK